MMKSLNYCTVGFCFKDSRLCTNGIHLSRMVSKQTMTVQKEFVIFADGKKFNSNSLFAYSLVESSKMNCALIREQCTTSHLRFEWEEKESQNYWTNNYTRRPRVSNTSAEQALDRAEIALHALSLSSHVIVKQRRKFHFSRSSRIND